MDELFPPKIFRGLPCSGKTVWTPRKLVWVSLIMNWLPGKTLGERFSAARHFVKFVQPHWEVPVAYSGFVTAQVRWWPLLGPVLQAALRPGVSFGSYWRVFGWLVLAVDGTRVECPRTTANEEGLKCAGREKTCPQVFQTTLQHVGTGLPWDVRLGPGTDSERRHLDDMLRDLPAQCLLTADAGFISYELCRWLCQNAHPFVMRVGGNITLLTGLGWEYDREEGDKGSVYLWPKEKRDGPAVRLRAVRFNSTGGLPVVLLTNVDSQRLPDEAVREIYKLRWGIELYYRTMKQTWGFAKLESRTPATTLNEQWWRVVSLWALQKLTAVKLQAQGKDPANLSGATVRRQIREFLQMLEQNRTGPPLEKRLGNACKDNYRRSGPKQTRLWPRKKHETPPKPPKQRAANEQEIQQAKRLGIVQLLVS
jgi:hypothetical protein